MILMIYIKFEIETIDTPAVIRPKSNPNLGFSKYIRIERVSLAFAFAFAVNTLARFRILR